MRLHAFIWILALVVCTFAQASNQTDVERARRYVDELHERMRDPDSFVLERAYVSVIKPLTKEAAKRLGKKAAAKYERTVGLTEFCFEYRSRNGYGGMNRGVAVTLASSGELAIFDPQVLDQIGQTCPAVRPVALTDITSALNSDH